MELTNRRAALFRVCTLHPQHLSAYLRGQKPLRDFTYRMLPHDEIDTNVIKHLKDHPVGSQKDYFLLRRTQVLEVAEKVGVIEVAELMAYDTDLGPVGIPEINGRVALPVIPTLDEGYVPGSYAIRGINGASYRGSASEDRRYGRAEPAHTLRVPLIGDGELLEGRLAVGERPRLEIYRPNPRNAP